jgi:hypothetical protein
MYEMHPALFLKTECDSATAISREQPLQPPSSLVTEHCLVHAVQSDEA